MLLRAAAHAGPGWRVLGNVFRGFAGVAPAQRSARFNTLNDDDVKCFKELLGDSGVITDPGSLEPFNRDWMCKYMGASRVALRPKTTQQVSEILAYCSLRRLALVPQGGNTGLVGGSVPLFDEVVLSMGAMNRIITMDQATGVLTAQAGAVLQTLDEAAGAAGFTVPLDLGAKGSCQIGGNVSTNAGGLRLLRYGSLHGSVLGLEVVQADGTVLDLLSPLRKDNTGYDLKQLFIGSEGSLGVVTAVALQCAPKPSSVQVAFLEVPSFVAVQGVLAEARARLGEILSAVEFLDAGSMQLATRYLPGATNPLAKAADSDGEGPGPSGGGGDGEAGVAGPDDLAGSQSHGAPFYMVVETSGSNEGHDGEKLEQFLEAVMDTQLVHNGTLAESSGQAAGIWRVREGITEALVRRGATYKYDLSIPLPSMYHLVEEMRGRVAHLPGVLVVGYGHVGDGNMHLNISAPEYRPEVLQAIEPFVYEWTARHGGSISAEHGMGQMKADCMAYSQPPEAIALMAQLKHLMDPHGILNPYKVLPGEALASVYGSI